MRNKYILISTKFDSIEFDKDELIGTIENFEEFDREGRSLRAVCESEIAKLIGVPSTNVYVSKIDWNDHSKYRANYRVDYFVNETEIKTLIREHIHENGAGLISCEITNIDNETVYVKLSVLYTRSTKPADMMNITASAIKQLLEEKYPDLKFSIDEKVNMYF